MEMVFHISKYFSHLGIKMTIINAFCCFRLLYLWFLLIITSLLSRLLVSRTERYQHSDSQTNMSLLPPVLLQM